MWDSGKYGRTRYVSPGQNLTLRTSGSSLLNYLFTIYCKSPESQYHDRKGGKMPFQPNVVILKGRAIDRCLNDGTHIFTMRVTYV